ncbi:MAG: CRISPR-associated helicase Cas3' [Candidatus Rokuibacteriota bacterium]
MQLEGAIAANDLTLLWAKTGISPSGERTEHPLVCHLIDVSVVARAMWDTVLPAAARLRFAAQLGVDEPSAGCWVSFFAAMHDLGKASPAFQLQHEPARKRLEARRWPLPRVRARERHGAITAHLLTTLLPEYGLPPGVGRHVAVAVGGHHGLFPAPGTRFDVVVTGAGPWTAAQRELVCCFAELAGVSGHAPPRTIDLVTAVVLAGLVSVADWIGSNTAYFPHRCTDGGDPAPVDILQYREEAVGRARHALRELGWAAWGSPAGGSRFQDCFPGLTSRPVQDVVAGLTERLAGPGLVIIEAPMGEGKTEAALYLADRWNAALGQHGFYIALPTQATSDQMFSRVREFLARRYPGDLVNVQLLHGHASLSAEFEELRREGDRRLHLQDVHGDQDHGAGAVVAAEWFTYRKRGLLAAYGVGTIDQALLAVLQARHVFVRQFGLASKVVVLDEVHAYDTYMSHLLERLLAWLAALRAPVVVLSATLPSARRSQLVAAYREGSGMQGHEDTGYVAYPRVTWTIGDNAGAVHAPGSPGRSRAVGVAWVDMDGPDRQSALERLGDMVVDKLAGGGTAAVVCNTVKRAQEVYRVLASRLGQAVDLLHARYPFDERQARQARALRRFGRPGPATERPARAVLVATQIIEQSLDLDFDLLVTDFAPVDLVLQRLGRLHRHERPRPPGLSEPVAWVGRPAITDGGCPAFGPAGSVYDDHVLLRSWLALGETDRLLVPDDIDPLVQVVYAEIDVPPPGLGEALARQWRETLREERSARDGARAEAEVRWLPMPTSDVPLPMLMRNPREEDEPEIHPAHQALTRLAEPSVSIVLLHATPGGPATAPEGGQLVDLSRSPSAADAARLLGRSVTFSDRRLVRLLQAKPVPAAWQRSPLLRHHRAVILGADGAATFGHNRLLLDPELGVVIETEAP